MIKDISHLKYNISLQKILIITIYVLIVMEEMMYIYRLQRILITQYISHMVIVLV
nr:MAG TPA: hypothetical protein [Caudoviricetes sp.]